jgi:TRAP-type mannitol/chloroaromatic compound transport system substrate-binding protein
VEASATSNLALAMREYSKDLSELQSDAGVTVHRSSKEILAAQLESWDKLITDLEAEPFIKKVMDSQREWVQRTAFYKINNDPDYKLAFNHYYPERALKF